MSTIFNYTVLAGDTLSKIAAGLDAAAGVSIAAIEAANPGVAPDALQIGMLLNIPAQSSSTIVLKYTVQAGDSYSKIATDLAGCSGITYQQIEQANPGINPDALQVGQILSIPATVAPPSSGLIGIWYWTWSKGGGAPAGANLGIAFSGWVDPPTAIQDSNAVKSQLPGTKYICLGGGNSSGAWTADAVQAVTNAIGANSFAGYQGIAYDIEEGSAGLASAFALSFAAAKAKGFQVLVTVSHSAPYGISDAATLMQSFFANPDIDILSPQLYTTGQETSNQYDISDGVTWNEYASAKAVIAPSIVSANLYASAQQYFSDQGVALGGFVQWQQGS